MKYFEVDTQTQTVKVREKEDLTVMDISAELGYGYIGSFKMKEGIRAYFKPEEYKNTLSRGVIRETQEFYSKAIFTGFDNSNNLAPLETNSTIDIDSLKALIRFDNLSSATDLLLAENGIALSDKVVSPKNTDKVTYAELFHRLNDALEEDRKSVYDLMERYLDAGETLDWAVTHIYEEVNLNGQKIYGSRNNITPVRSSV